MEIRAEGDIRKAADSWKAAGYRSAGKRRDQ